MHSDIKEWIKVGDCKDGWLYVIAARNSTLGIYEEKTKAFIISRYKFTDNYLFHEIHWDSDPMFGTVKPLKILEEAPSFKDDKSKLRWLNGKRKEYKKEIERAGLYEERFI